MMKITTLYYSILLLLIGHGEACEDRKGTSYCLFLLKPKANNCRMLLPEELLECHKTCKVCTEAPVGVLTTPPSWAVQPTARPTLYPNNNRPSNNNQGDSSGLSIPLWAVVLIVVGLIALFIASTCLVIKIKRKCKKWKMNKNHRMLMNAPPAANTLASNHAPGYIWQLDNEGRLNPSFEYGNTNKNLYLPEKSMHEPPNMVNNLGTREKNTNEFRNTSIKAKAPQVPIEDDKKQMNNARTNTMRSTKSKAPEPPKQVDEPSAHEVVEIPIEYTESMISFATEDENHKSASSKSDEADAPPVPPRMPLIMKMSTETDATYATIYRDKKKRSSSEDDKISEHDEEDRRSSKDSQRTSSSDSDSTISDVTLPPSKHEFANDALINVMEKWKDHLQDQKKELEDYYSRLATYVGKLALDQARHPPHFEDNESVITDATTMTWMQPPMQHRSASMPQNHRRESETTYDFSLKDRALSQRFDFPEPPESIRGDFDIEPYNLESQQQVINGLKSKLSELHAVLKSTNDVVSEAETMTTWKPRDEFEVQQMMPSKPVVNRDALMAAQETHFTIKFLLDQFDRKKRIEVQIKIAEAFDSVRNRGGMVISAKDGHVTCLAKQVHHVMTDLLDPRTNTKLSLGAQAALNLSMKLRRGFLKNIYPAVKNAEARESMKANVEHTIVICKQLVDMTNQLLSREASFRTKDYLVFANTFVETAVKVMEETYKIKTEIEMLKKQRADELKMKTMSKGTLREPHGPPNLTANDVKQLNEGLARLEAVLNGQLPASSIGTTSYNDEYQTYDDAPDDDSEMDTLSAYSCSTCAPNNTGYDNMCPSHMTASAFGHPPNKAPKDRVQYTEVFPYSKPKRGKLPKNEVLLNKNDAQNLPFDNVSSDQRTNTIGASSFSFRTSNNSKNGVLRQPRHEAMMARYFNGSEPPKPATYEDKLNKLPPATNASNAELTSPAANMLPCGMVVANDTPPLTDIPKEKKIRGSLGKIPKITVVRNGAEMNKTGDKEVLPIIEEDQKKTNEEAPKPIVPPPPPPPVDVPKMNDESKPETPLEESNPEETKEEPKEEEQQNKERIEHFKALLKAKFNRQESETSKTGDENEDEDAKETASEDDLDAKEDSEDDNSSSESSSDEEEALFNYPATEDDENLKDQENS